MNHKQFKQWLELSLYGELDVNERKGLEDHLQGCAECRNELEQLKKLHDVFAKHKRVTLSHETLADARRQFRLTLQERLSRPPLWERLIEPVYKISFSGIATLAVGFVIGYVMSSVPQLQTVVGNQVADTAPVLEGGSQITNVRFLDPDATDGEVEFTFDVVRPVRLKGNLNDPQVQKVLAHALVNSQNPGVRLRTVNALSGQGELLRGSEIRDALLGAIVSDANPAVRKEAVTLLQKLPFDDEIKEAILYVLQNDQNSGVRIAAIMTLVNFKDQSLLKDEKVRKILQEKINSDENNFIRLMAQTFLEENTQQ